jgi:hypothetical protein
VDDITDPIAILLAEVRAARENLRHLLNRLQIERRELEWRLESLSRSPRLTDDQRQRLFDAIRKTRHRA